MESTSSEERTMSDTKSTYDPLHALPMVLANELCGRARNHYLTRRGIDDPGWRHEVQYGVPHTDRQPGPDGWMHISNLSDRIDGMYYRILWHPETDQLRLQGPRK
jgi:hypothetical protein